GVARARQPDRAGDVRDRRWRLSLVGAGPADDARDPALLALHQARPPAPPAPCPTGRSRRAGGSRGMGSDQPVADISDQELLRLLKQAASDPRVKAWIVGGYVRDVLLARAHPHPA